MIKRAHVLQQLAEAQRHLHPEAVILAACFEQSHTMPARLAQARGDHASGRTRADHDVIKFA